MAIRLIGLALALPSSSYFSNYEVFIAERRISKVASQLIKLVYVSLLFKRHCSSNDLNTRRCSSFASARDRPGTEGLLKLTGLETNRTPGRSYSPIPPG